MVADSISIQEFIKAFKYQSIMLLKMDIEGSERALLRECEYWLPRTDLLFVELHPDICPDILSEYNDACVRRTQLETIGEKRLSLAID